MALQYWLSIGALLTDPFAPITDLPAHVPPSIALDSRAANNLLSRIDDCVDRHPGFEDDIAYERLSQRLTSLDAAVEQVWGKSSPVEMRGDLVPRHRLRCDKATIASSLKHIDQHLDRGRREFDLSTRALSRRIWIGNMKLCRADIVDASFGEEPITGQISLKIRLEPSATDVLARMTRRRVNQRIAVRLNGEIVSTPMIYEPIEGGMLEVTGPPRSVLERLDRTLHEPC